MIKKEEKDEKYAEDNLNRSDAYEDEAAELEDKEVPAKKVMEIYDNRVVEIKHDQVIN